MKIILHTFKTLVETFHGTSLPPKIIRQFSNADNYNTFDKLGVAELRYEIGKSKK